MIFIIEEVSFENSLQSYQSSCIFDEMLEFYSFLNVWAVHENEQFDQLEKYYYKHDKAVEHSDELYEKVQKVLFILSNIEFNIKKVEQDMDKLTQCKSELRE